METDWQALCMRLFASIMFVAEEHPDMTMDEFVEKVGDLGFLSQEDCNVLSHQAGLNFMAHLKYILTPRFDGEEG